MPFRVWITKEHPPIVTFRDFDSREELEEWVEQHSDEWSVLLINVIPSVGVGRITDYERMKTAVLYSVSGDMSFHLIVTTDKAVHHLVYNNSRDLVKHRYKLTSTGEWHEETLTLKQFNEVLEEILTLGQIWRSDGSYETVEEIVGTMTCKLVDV